MRAELKPERRPKGVVAISIAAHVLLFIGLSAVTFHYGIEQIFFRTPPEPIPPIRYVRMSPNAAAATRGGFRSGTKATRPPATMMAPSSIPVGVPKPAPITAAPGVIAARGDGVGVVDTVRALGFGVQPGIPDARLTTNPLAVASIPRSMADRTDSAVAAIYSEYVESMKAEAARAGRDPRDWSWGGKDGAKWGWDPQGIHINGITIPNIVLAALPLRVGPTGNVNSLTIERANSFMTSDIKFHSGMMSKDEFTEAVRKVRERVDRERQEKMAKARTRTPPCCG